MLLKSQESSGDGAALQVPADCDNQLFVTQLTREHDCASCQRLWSLTLINDLLALQLPCSGCTAESGDSI